MSKRKTRVRGFRGGGPLKREEEVGLTYMLELVETADGISRKHDFGFLSYLLAMSRNEILDILNYSAPARTSIDVELDAPFAPVKPSKANANQMLRKIKADSE